MPPRVREEDILLLIRERGPLTEGELARSFDVSMMIMGAYLTTLVQQQKLKRSQESYRGSKLYYVEGQESLVAERLAQQLDAREKPVFERLHTEGVLADDTLSPAERIILRKHPDLAIPLILTRNGEERLVWVARTAREDRVRERISQLEKEKEERVRGEQGEGEAREEDHAKGKRVPRVTGEGEVDQRGGKASRAEEGKESKEDTDVKRREEAGEKKEEGKGREREEKPLTRAVRAIHDTPGRIRVHPATLARFVETHGISLERVLTEKEKEMVILARDTRLGIPLVLQYKERKSLSERDVLEALGLAMLYQRHCILLTPGRVSKRAESLLARAKHLTIHTLP